MRAKKGCSPRLNVLEGTFIALGNFKDLVVESGY